MQVTETLSEGLKRGFTVTVPAAEIASKRDARLKEVAANLNLPGFRPGKVPVSLAKQRYGESVWAEVLEQTVSDALRNVFDERGIRPAGQPKVDLVSSQEDDPLLKQAGIDIKRPLTARGLFDHHRYQRIAENLNGITIPHTTHSRIKN